MKREPRLQFTDAERADPELEKPTRKAEKAAAKADTAQAKIPKKTVKVKERAVDAATGKAVTHLKFEAIQKKKPPSKLTHALRDAPGNTMAGALHREITKSEDDNVGVESVHKLEETAEAGGRIAQSARRSHQLKPYRKAVAAEHRLEKANVNALYRKSLRENPQFSSNPLSRWQQKRAIRKQYAVAKRTGQAATGTAKVVGNSVRTAKTAVKRGEQTASFLWRHKKGLLVVLALSLMVCFLLNCLSSCSLMMEGGLSAIGGSTYPSRDEDMLNADAEYAGMEADLQYEVDHYERLHPGYDEYRYSLDEIKHDPYVLISLLTAYHRGEWTLAEMHGTLQMIFDRQYSLSQNVVVETRYRIESYTWTDSEGNSHTGTRRVPYRYYICNVTLKNFDLSHLPAYLLDEDGLNLYAVYMATLGNRPDLFPVSQYPNASQQKEYTDYDVPVETLEDETFAAMLAEAEKYLGYPYVWGGSNPSTSFDCSGYVSWVINHSGWNVGRLCAQGLYNICTPVSASIAHPGDLVFFVGTYETSGISHCGIYVGGGMMIHCGSPISYTSIDSNYWQTHLYAFGRLP